MALALCCYASFPASSTCLATGGFFCIISPPPLSTRGAGIGGKGKERRKDASLWYLPVLSRFLLSCPRRVEALIGLLAQTNLASFHLPHWTLSAPRRGPLLSSQIFKTPAWMPSHMPSHLLNSLFTRPTWWKKHWSRSWRTLRVLGNHWGSFAKKTDDFCKLLLSQGATVVGLKIPSISSSSCAG